ncbi:MAG: diaminopimelate epimerase [Alphaproteobacteria bacterium]
MSDTAFIKMHGLGNDFVIIDCRAAPVQLTSETVRLISDRNTGVGCDQLILIESSATSDVFMRIHNANGGEVEACGNATRCVAKLLFSEAEKDSVIIETLGGKLRATANENGQITVNMGPPKFYWQDIPLSEKHDTLHLPIAVEDFEKPTAVNMGNPHCVFFVTNTEAIDLPALGPLLEKHPLFPEHANIGFAEQLDDNKIRLRVWERGAGITKACGTGACAAAVAGARLGLTERSASVKLDGGTLQIDWRQDDHVWMTGPAQISFHGKLDLLALNKGLD